MKKLIVLLIIAAIGWQAYGKHQRQTAASLADESPAAEQHVTLSAPPVEKTNSSYRCDGRTYCSQMTSCEEATWFLRNCPDTKMDGDHDGIPCEQQWCSK